MKENFWNLPAELSPEQKKRNAELAMQDAKRDLDAAQKRYDKCRAIVDALSS